MFSIHVYTSVHYLYHTLNENGEIKKTICSTFVNFAHNANEGCISCMAAC